MKPLRTVRLAIHPGRHSTSWSLVHRTDDGRTVFDRRLHAGTLSHMGVIQGIADVSATLRQIADEMDRRHGIPSPEAAREPLGAVGGGPEDTGAPVGPSGLCPACGAPLDTSL